MPESNSCQNIISNRDMDELGLPRTTRKYEYQGKERFEEVIGGLSRIVPSLDNEYVVFYIDQATFERDFLEGDGIHVLYTFNPIKKVLTVKMASRPHSLAPGALSMAIWTALLPMGLTDALDNYFGAKIEHPGGVKVPDAGWGPKEPPQGHPYGPTVVLEIGFTESYAKLRRDVEMWVDPARGNASVALAMKINTKIPSIKLERVEWDTATEESQATQVIIMSKNESGQITISDSPLVIPFEALFQRPPASPSTPASPVEKDIEINEQALSRIASDIWRSQPEEMRCQTGSNPGVVPKEKEDVTNTFSFAAEPQAPPRTRSPLARSHLRSRSLAGIPGMPSMTRAYSSPGLDSQGRYIFVNGRGTPVDAKRYPLQMRPDDYIDRMGSLNISETISENAELEPIPKPPSQPASSPILMAQNFPRIGRLRTTSPLPLQTPVSPSLHSSPILGSKYNESFPSYSGSSVSSISIPSTPTSLRSRSPSISSLETIPDIPDAENEALEEDRIAKLKAAADEADAATNANRRRGASDTPNSFTTMRGGSAGYTTRSDKRKRWSVCGAERRQDLDLETIWED
ncbi:unnamed protein product [Penicillium glandicola]